MNKLYLNSLRLAALTVAGLLLSGFTARAQTPPWPQGDWDLVFSGSQLGLAVITFNADNTLTGYEIVRPYPKKGATTDIDNREERHVGQEPGRTTVTTSGGSSPKVVTNLLGSAPLSGVWYASGNNKAVGIINQLSLTVEPVVTYSTNQVGEILTNTVYVIVQETNAVSFKASGVAGSRMTINSYGPDGSNILRGKPVDPAQATQNGDYFAGGVRDTLNYVEFSTFLQDSGLPTRYDIDGIGPGYSFTGRALVSRSKQIAIVTLSSDGTDVLSVYTGSYSLISRKGKLNGLDSSNRKLKYNISPLP